MDTVGGGEAQGFARELAEEIGKQVTRAVVEVLAQPETRRALASALGTELHGAAAKKKDAGGCDKPTCSEPGCGRPARARGLCSKHYQRLRYREKRSNAAGPDGDGALKRGMGVCEVEGCDQQVYARKMCSKHFMEWVRSRRKS